MDKNIPTNNSNSIDEAIFDPDKLTQAYEKADRLFGHKINDTTSLKTISTSYGPEANSPSDSNKPPKKTIAKKEDGSVTSVNSNWLKIAMILATLISCFLVIYYLDEIYLLFH